MKLDAVDKAQDHLSIDISGTVSRFHYFWLRDNCPDCRSRNGQKLHETNALDPAVAPRAVEWTADALSIEWSDGFQSNYPATFLAEWRYDPPPAVQDRRVLWSGDLSDRVQRHRYADVCTRPAALKAWLNDVAAYGLGLLQGVPASEGKIFDVVRLFGFVRETNYGRLFDVRAEENASNLAFTPQPLSVHTDNPYRDPCPTLQLLHCLVQAERGGLSALADGFHAAERLRRENPGAFELLTRNEVAFHYESDAAVLDNRDCIIGLDANGAVERIRINNRSLAPLQLPFDAVPGFYAALAAFRAILESSDAQFRLLLAPGDLLIVDNERVLHGRAGESIGERHLQGCYADRDGLLSTLEVLDRARG